MYTQGNIIPKIWLFKDRNSGEIKGPYMSFDMDIWNAKGGFFDPE